jgi:hypothetical protein
VQIGWNDAGNGDDLAAEFFVSRMRVGQVRQDRVDACGYL